MPPNIEPPSHARHVPVMLAEVMNALAPESGDVILDGTFGAGGYTRAILTREGTQVIAIDRDPNAILAGWSLVSAMKGRLTLVEDRFGALDTVARNLGFEAVAGVVLDIGVSSMQLDEADRGFSFRQDGPLDMRMEGKGETAADLVNGMAEGDLARLFQVLGEERRAGALARAIVTDRVEKPFLRTSDLASLCGRVIRSRPGDIHPATRAFQALRIAVNHELDELGSALFAAERILQPGGRLVVVTFHSLEDRIVKNFLLDRSRVSDGGSRHRPEATLPPPTFTLPFKGVATAGEAEIAANPRARSAKLRAAVRTTAPPRHADIQALGIPHFEQKVARRR